jgi:hypothetical protein
MPAVHQPTLKWAEICCLGRPTSQSGLHTPTSARPPRRPSHHLHPHLDILIVVAQRRQAILVGVAEVSQQQVDVRAVAVEHRAERGVGALHRQPLVILVNRLPQVELLLVRQPSLEGIVAEVLQAAGGQG